jgi:hypothetical protein
MNGGMRPEQVVASFDSASVLHAATAAALRGRPFPHLGNPAAYGRLVRVGGRLPWPLLKQIYARIGGAEGIPPERLSEVDLSAVATSFAAAYPARRYPAVLVGSSNGALAHLAAALQVPWLPQTVLVPVHRVSDPQRADQALEFGRRWGPRLLAANPGVVLHQMHDAAQDELMTARMAYFRTKWRELPHGYGDFLATRLAPGAPVILVEDTLRWPVTRVADRHWFQTGGVGGLTPADYLSRPDAPAADAEAPEAEWGADPDFVAAVRRWAADHDHPLVPLRYEHPQTAAHPVAGTIRRWLAEERGEPADRLLVPSFVLGDPWTTLNLGAVPFWTFFPVQSAVRALDDHLGAAEPYREVDVLMFQHGAESPGVAHPEDFAAVIRRHGAEPRLLALRPQESPHDIGSLGRYGPLLAGLSRARRPWAPMPVAIALRGLSTMIAADEA